MVHTGNRRRIVKIGSVVMGLLAFLILGSYDEAAIGIEVGSRAKVPASNANPEPTAMNPGNTLIPIHAADVTTSRGLAKESMEHGPEDSPTEVRDSSDPSGAALLHEAASGSEDAEPQLSDTKVLAVKGDAYIPSSEEDEKKFLRDGDSIAPWQTLFTDTDGFLLLSWNTEILTSIGPDSNIFLSSREVDGRTMADLQLIDGQLRVAPDENRMSHSLSYTVTTPSAMIWPDSQNGPVDFVVEVHDPSTTIVTVLLGTVRVKNLSIEDAPDQSIDPCNTVYVAEKSPKYEIRATSAEDVQRLIQDTTIPNTLHARGETCAPASATTGYVQEEPEYQYFAPDYTYVDTESIGVTYPYREIRVMPPHVAGGEFIVVLPGIGQWAIPYAVYRRWNAGPSAIAVCVRRLLIRRTLYDDFRYRRYLAIKEHELSSALHLAQMARDTETIYQLQRRLDYIRIRQHWMERRIHNMQRRIRTLEAENRQVFRRGPSTANLFNLVSDSFNSTRNLAIAQRFRQMNQDAIQSRNQLAGVASAELVNLRSRLARERNPAARRALSREIRQARRAIREGRLPIRTNQRDVARMVKELNKTTDPGKRSNIRAKLVKDLGEPAFVRSKDLVTQDKISRLERKLSTYQSPRHRELLDRRAKKLRKAVRERQKVEATQKKIENILSRAAREKNTERRLRLLNRVERIAAEQAVPGKGMIQLLKKQQLLEARAEAEQDKTKRRELRKELREETKRQQKRAQQLRGRSQWQAERKKELRDKDKKRKSEPKTFGKTEKRDAEQARKAHRRRQQELRKQEQEKRAASQARKSREQAEKVRRTRERKARQEAEQARKARERNAREQQHRKQQELRKQQQEKRAASQARKSTRTSGKGSKDPREEG
jgi:hypothetical protein